MALLTDGLNLGARVGVKNADPTGSKDSDEGRGPNEAGSAGEADSGPLAARLAGMTITEIEKAIESGEFTAQEAADTEATRDEPRVGVLALATN